MKINIRTNIPAVSTRLMKNPAKIGRAIKRAIQKSALLVERHAKMRTPVDTGRLRSSIKTTLSRMTATVNPTVDYAIFVHDGTSRMKGRPFMHWGTEDAKDKIQTVFEREIKGALR